MSFFYLTFRVASSVWRSELHLQLGVQSHFFYFKHSKLSFSVQAFRAICLSVGIQSHLFRFQAFKATFFILGIQSHHAQFRHSNPLCSAPPSLVQAFRATFISFRCSEIFQFRHLEPPSSVRHSKPPCLIRRSKPLCLVQAFRATFHSLGVQSHLSQSGVQSHFPQFRRSEPPCSIQAIGATFLILGVQSHLAQLRHSEPPFLVRCSKSLSQLSV